MKYINNQYPSARGRDNTRVVRRLPCGITICVAILVLFIGSSSRPVAAQPGLQNYNCGGPAIPEFNDTFGAIWTNDSQIVADGEGSPAKTVLSVVGPGYYLNEWIHLRYFNKSGPSEHNHTKYCFRPPVTPYVPYFVRGRFIHGGYDGQILNNDTNAVQIGIEIDGQLFQSLPMYNSTSNFAFTFILATRKNYMEVCLVREGGNPFINILELKEFDPASMYLDTAHGDILTVAGRPDFGTPPGSKTFRLPDDKFDRNWPPSNNTNTTVTPPILLSSIVPNISAPPVWNQPPDRAMRNAITCLANQSLIFRNQGFIDNLKSNQRFIVYLYFAELDHNVQVGQRVFDIIQNDIALFEAVDILRLSGGLHDRGVQLILNITTALQKEPFTYTLRPTANSLYGPILNAAEAMGVLISRNPGRLIDTAKSSTSIGLIAGVVAGVAVVAIAILVLVICCLKKKSRKHKKPPSRVHGKPPSSGPGGKDGGVGGTYREVHRYTHSEVEAMSGNWNHELGKGGFGSVYLGLLPAPEGSPEKPKKVALKKLSTTSHQGTTEFLNEVDLLSRVHHSKLVSLVGYCDDSEHVLIYDFMEEGTLDEWLYGSKSGNPHFDWDRRLHIAMDAAIGLDYLHTGANPNIIHRDVKTSNILLNKNWEGRVADFGLSKTGSDTENNKHVSTMVKGTIGYLDPEYYSSARLTNKSDVYSFGVVLLEMVVARRPLDTTVAVPQHRTLASFVKLCYKREDVSSIVDPNLNGNYSTESVCTIVELALKCLSNSSFDRPSMADVVDEIKAAIKLENLNRPLKDQSSYDYGDMDYGDIDDGREFVDPNIKHSWAVGESSSSVHEISNTIPPSDSSVLIPR